MSSMMFSLPLILASLPSVAAVTVPADVNSQLLSFQQETFGTPTLQKMSDRVTMAFSYDYANFTLIEGDDGVVVVDTGFYTNNAKRALADYQKLVKKPVTAIIYTHVHSDHRGGSPIFLAEAKGDIPVIAPAGWEERHEYDVSELRPMVVKRALSQFGMLLEDGVEGTVGAGIGPITHINGASLFVKPNKTIFEKTKMTISGVELEFIPLPGDIESHMMVWVPKEKVLISGDLIGGTLPYIATARFEADRKAELFVSGLNRILEYDAKSLVPGHGRPLLGRDEIKNVITANRDVTEYLIDQITRYIAKGYTVETIVDELKLPPYLKNHKDLQPHYHTLAWLIRGLYVKRAGWVDDTLSLVKLSESEQTSRLIKLIGGKKTILTAAEKAIKDKDYRWAAQLADYVWTAEPENKEAIQLLISAYRGIANITNSANERNFSLTEISTLKGKIPWDKFLQKSTFNNQKDMDNERLLHFLKYQYKAERDYNFSGEIAVKIDGDEKTYLLTVQNGVLRTKVEKVPKGTSTITLNRLQLRQVVSSLSSLSAMYEQGVLRTSGDKTQLVKFINML